MIAELKMPTMKPPEITGDNKKMKPKQMPIIGRAITLLPALANAGLLDFLRLITMPKPKIERNSTQNPNKNAMTNIASPAGIVMNKIPMIKSIAPDNNDQPQLLF